MTANHRPPRRASTPPAILLSLAAALVSLHRSKASAWRAMHRAQWAAWEALQADPRCRGCSWRVDLAAAPDLTQTPAKP